MSAQKQLAREISRIARVIRIESPTAFVLGAQRFSIDRPLDDEGDASTSTAIISYLAREIYYRFYCRTFELERVCPVSAMLSPSDFVAALSAANCSRDRIDPCWKLVDVLPTGHALLQKNGLMQIKHTSQWLKLNSGSDAGACANQVAIIGLKESQRLHPGFYLVYGESSLDDQDDRDLVRFYWNIEAPGATYLVRHLTVRLNLFEVPFRLKCLNNPASYIRADAAVLYVNKNFYRVAAEIVRETHTILSPYLRLSSPLFTKHLAPGIGFAEDPNNGESFGQNRSRILAEAIWDAHLTGTANAVQKLRFVCSQLVRRGVDLAYPYLNPGSSDRYLSPFSPQ